MSLDIFFFFFISSLPCQGPENGVGPYNLFVLGRFLPGKQLAACLFLGRQPTSYTPQQESEKTLRTLLRFLSRFNIYLSMTFPLYPNGGLRPGLCRSVEEQFNTNGETGRVLASLERQFSQPRKPSEKADKAHSQVANRLWSKHCLAPTHIFFPTESELAGWLQRHP